MRGIEKTKGVISRDMPAVNTTRFDKMHGALKSSSNNSNVKHNYATY